jgi:hypothetical protein
MSCVGRRPNHYIDGSFLQARRSFITLPGAAARGAGGLSGLVVGSHPEQDKVGSRRVARWLTEPGKDWGATGAKSRQRGWVDHELPGFGHDQPEATVRLSAFP